MDARYGAGPLDQELIRPLAASSQPVMVLLNKIDLVPHKPDLIPRMAALHTKLPEAEIFPISARTGDGLTEMLSAVTAHLPEGPALFPEDQWTTQAENFFVAELVREKVLAACRDELSYAVAVEIVQAREDEEKNLLSVHARLLCDKDGQKAILIGKGGAMIRDIGTAARQEIEELLGVHLFLDLQVKVAAGWRNNPSVLRQLTPSGSDDLES
jgi:GTPase